MAAKEHKETVEELRGQLRACVEAHGKQLMAEEERRLRAQSSAQLIANKHRQLTAEMDALRSEKIRLAASLSAELSEQQEKLRLEQEIVDAFSKARTFEDVERERDAALARRGARAVVKSDNETAQLRQTIRALERRIEELTAIPDDVLRNIRTPSKSRTPSSAAGTPQTTGTPGPATPADRETMVTIETRESGTRQVPEASAPSPGTVAADERGDTPPTTRELAVRLFQ